MYTHTMKPSLLYNTLFISSSAAELLREAEKLIEQKLHPQTIISGWRIAVAAAKKALAESSFDHNNKDDIDEAALRVDLENIARTTLSSKILSNHKEYVKFNWIANKKRRIKK